MTRNMHARKIIETVLLVFLLLGISCRSGFAVEQDETLEVMGRPALEEVTVGRFPKLLSQTPENVTVISEEEIAALNAHTLSDILENVTGIQIDSKAGPVGASFVHIQGSLYNHVQVVIDGVTINNLTDNFSDIGLIPARIIERVEIVKGAASSAWGQALGGVINVVTKSPDRERKGGGTASFSHGERETLDGGGEVSGVIDKFGYYLSGGYFGSGGFKENTQARFKNAYSKLTYDLAGQGQIRLTANFMQADRGEFAFAPLDLQAKDFAKRGIFTLSFQKPVLENLTLDLSARHSINIFGPSAATMSTSQTLLSIRDNERTTGASAKLALGLPYNNVVLGFDYDNVSMKDNDSLNNTDILHRSADRLGFYLNDTISFWRLAFSPGIRFDRTGSSGDQVSPTFGFTWQLADNITLRGYTGRGFDLPLFTQDRPSEKVWTNQLGIETTLVPFIWLKGTLFRNDTWDITINNLQDGTKSLERQIKKGAEAEFRTTPVFNTTLFGGYCFVDARRKTDSSQIEDVPRHSFNLGLLYDDKKLLRAAVNGRYVDWHAASYHNGAYFGTLWDAHLTATPFGRSLYQPEFFLSLRNIFNKNQYLDEILKNPGRWFEGGVRFRF